MSTSSSNLRESGMHAPEPLRPPSIWALAWRMLWRDLRAGEWRLLVLAVALAVAALGGVAEATSIEYVFWLCSFLPFAGLLTVFLPNMEKGRAR